MHINIVSSRKFYDSWNHNHLLFALTSEIEVIVLSFKWMQVQISLKITWEDFKILKFSNL